MPRLLLMRHAKAGPYEPGADSQRPLVERGREDAARAGEHLRSLGVVPDMVLCSPATRTRETLECASVALGPDTEVRDDARIYGASAGELIGIVQEVDDDVETLMLVGHNPGTQMLAVTLAGRGAALEQLAAKFPTAGVADLRFNQRWAEAAPGIAELAGFYVPRDWR